MSACKQAGPCFVAHRAERRTHPYSPNEQKLARIAEAGEADVDAAVKAAGKAWTP